MNPLPRSGTPVFRFTRFLVAVVAALLIVPLAVHAQSVPNAPTGLTATPGDGQVTLSWDDPGDTTITGYQASSDDGTSYSAISGSDANTISHTVDYLTNGTEYSFKVRAVNEAGTGAASAAVSETPLIAAPKNLGVTVGDGQVTLGWDDPDNSSISRYQVSSNGGTSYSTISGSDADTVQYIKTGLTNGTSYTFAVRAVNGAAAFVWATPTATSEAVPAAPSNLQASAGDGQVTLSWADPDDTTITGYQVSSDDGTSYSAISGSDANTISHTVDDLTNGTEYSFKVRAVNVSGTGAPATVTATPLFAAPRNLGVTVGDEQVELRWADPDNDSIDSYEVSSDGGTSYSEISGSDEDTTSHTVTGLTNGTSYSFAVRAVNGAAATVSATPTATSETVPAAPSILQASPGGGQVTLSWTNPNNNSISFYQVSSDGGTNYDPIEESDAATTSHTVVGLTGGAEHSFAVRAVNEKGTGAAATETETPLFAAPTNLGAAVGDGQVTLGWDDPDNDNISGYEVSSNDGANYSTISGSDEDTTSHTVTGLTNATSYSFAVRAVKASVTGVAATVSATPTVPSVAVPAAPTDLTAEAGDTQATLSWVDPGNTTITGYQVSSNGGTSYGEISGSDANTISHTVTGLTNGTEYSFAVRAVNEAGTGAPATVTATPLFAAPKKLGSAAGDGQVTLRWDDPGDTTITGYEVSSEAGLWGYSVISGSGASTTSHTVTGLTNGTHYTFAVRAVNGAAAFVWATPTVTSVAVPAAPTTLEATAGGGQVTLSWPHPGDTTITGYQYSQDGGTRFRVAYRSDEDTTSHVARLLTGGTEYSFLVRAVNEAGTGAWSDPAVSATPKFKAPKNLGATVGDGQVTLSWDDPVPSNDNISFYQVSSNGGTSYSAISNSDANTISHTVTGLTNGTEYSFKVRAVNASVSVIGVEATVSATPTVPSVAVPAAPSNLRVTNGDGQATLYWNNPPSNSNISSYELSSDGGTTYSAISGSGASTTSHTVTGLTNWTSYYFALRAVNEAGTGAPATLPPRYPGDAHPGYAHPGYAPTAQPGSFTANPLHERVELSWTAPDDIEETPINGYKLRKKRRDKSEWGSEYTFVFSYTTEYDLDNEKTYDYKLRTFNDFGFGPYITLSTKPVPKKPEQPTGLTVVAGDGEVALTWDAPDDRHENIDYYRLSRYVGDPNPRSISGDVVEKLRWHEKTIYYTQQYLTNGKEYEISLLAENSAGDSDPSVRAAAVTPLFKAPSNLQASPGYGEVALSWTNAVMTWESLRNSTFSGFDVSSDGGTSYSTIEGSDEKSFYGWNDSIATTNSHTVENLTGGTEYSFAVRAVNGKSTGLVITTPRFAAPTNLGFTVGDGQVTLDWDNPSNSNISRYQVSIDGGAFDDIENSDAGTTSHTVTGLTNGTEYSFAVRAVNDSLTGAAATVSATPTVTNEAVPDAPTELTATAGDGQVALSWVGPSNSSIDSYEVSSDGGTTYSEISDSDEDTTSHTVTDLTNGTEYSFGVRAVNEAGTGAPATATATPLFAAPTDLQASPGGGQVTLSWTDPGNDDISRYEVSSDGGEFEDIDGSNASTTSHTVESLTGGTEYSFAVRARYGVASALVTATPLFAAPTGLTATAGDAQVTLSWDDPGNSSISGYKVSIDGGAFEDIVHSDGGADTVQYIKTGLTNGTSYSFAVRAVNDSLTGAASAAVSATPRFAAPTNLGVTVGDGQVTLGWDDPSNSSISGYELSIDIGEFDDIENSGATTTSHTVTGLTNGTSYTFGVRAVNGAAAWESATPTVTNVAVPLAPTSLQASAGDAQVTLSWADPGNSSITFYQVSSDGGTSYSAISDSGAATTSHTVTDLTNGTSYSFGVRAVNEAGTGAPATATAKPLFAALTDLQASPGYGQVTLSWTDPVNDDISGYQVSSDGGTNYSPISGSDVIIDTDANTISHTVENLTGGTAYSFAVRARYGVASALETATPLFAAPSNLRATAGDAQVTLDWDDPSNSNISRYQVSIDGGEFGNIDGSGATTTSHTVESLANGTSYSFAVRAVNDSLTGAAATVSATPLAVPLAPTSLEASAGDGQVTLSWDDPSNSSISGYQLSIDGGEFDAIGGSGATTTSHTVESLANGTAYSFVVRAVNASGAGAASVAVSATPLFAAPTNLGVAVGDGQVTLHWDDPENDNISGYQLSIDGGEFDDISDSDLIIDSDKNTISHTVTGLTNGTSYTFGVRAVNGAAAWESATPTVTNVAVPDAPTNLEASPGDGQVTLRWDDPENDSISFYQVSSDGGTSYSAISGSDLIIDTDTNTISHIVDDLTNGTTYSFGVRAVNEAGTGAPATDTATPLFAAPTNLEAFPNSGQVDLEWDTNDKVTDYMVDTKVTGTDVIYPSSLISASPDLTTTATILALTNGTRYTFRVVAVRRVVAVQSFLEISEPSSVSATPVDDAEVEEQMEFEVSFDAAAYNADEGSGPVRVGVKLSPPAAESLKIPIRVTPQGRTVPADYEVEGLDDEGKLTFEMNDTTRSFTIKATEQAEQDDNFHDVKVALGFGTLPANVTKGAPSAATLTIIDAEGAVVRARFRRLNDESLSKHALTIADVTNRAIGARMDDPRGKQAAAYTLAGGSTLYHTLRSNAQALEDGTLTLDDVLAGSSFRLPLEAANDDMAGGGPVVWGRGDRQVLESTDSAFAWNGTVLTGQLGIDTRLREDLLAGLALSRSIGEFDYTDGTGPAPAGGDYGSRMTSVHPYLGWLSPQGLTLWATVGYGRGEIEIEDAQVRDGDPDYPVRRSDTTLKTAAAGGRGPLIAADSPIAGGTMALTVRSEVSWAQVDVEGDGGLIAQQTVNAWRLRLALEGSHEQALASGSSLTPSLELGLRHDGGDGITGAGIEIGGGLRYRHPATGLTVEGNGRVLTGQSNYQEWGLGGSLRLDPSAEGRGLSFSLFPAWGETASGVDRLWDQDVAELASDDTAANDSVPQMRLDGELGYGFGAFGGRGLLTPYGGFALADEGSRRYRIGIRFEIAPAFDLSFEGARREPANDAAAEHRVMLRMQASW